MDNIKFAYAQKAKTTYHYIGTKEKLIIVQYWKEHRKIIENILIK